MSDSERLRDRLEFALDMIGRIERQMTHATLSDFEADFDKVDLLAFRVGQVGEAVHKLPKELTDRHPTIEWARLYRMRNIINHAYSSLIPAIMWDAAELELGDLRGVLEQELALLRP